MGPDAWAGRAAGYRLGEGAAHVGHGGARRQCPSPAAKRLPCALSPPSPLAARRACSLTPLRLLLLLADALGRHLLLLLGPLAQRLLRHAACRPGRRPWTWLLLYRALASWRGGAVDVKHASRGRRQSGGGGGRRRGRRRMHVCTAKLARFTVRPWRAVPTSEGNGRCTRAAGAPSAGRVGRIRVGAVFWLCKWLDVCGKDVWEPRERPQRPELRSSRRSTRGRWSTLFIGPFGSPCQCPKEAAIHQGSIGPTSLPGQLHPATVLLGTTLAAAVPKILAHQPQT